MNSSSRTVCPRRSPRRSKRVALRSITRSLKPPCAMQLLKASQPRSTLSISCAYGSQSVARWNRPPLLSRLATRLANAGCTMRRL
jgi:hypothetical protein